MLRSLQRIPLPRKSREVVRLSRHQPIWQVYSIDRRTITTVQTLDSWAVESFREHAFLPQTPATMSAEDSTLPIAIEKWFTHDLDSKQSIPDRLSRNPQLKTSFWSKYSDLIVPLEITHAASENSKATCFDRINGPLSILFADLEAKKDGVGVPRHSVYLAQHDLRDLPQELLEDLPTPELVRLAGKGDLYSSSLWLGRSPTYTPLHRDSNPNLLMQLAGTKIVRLLDPDVGDAVFEYAQRLIDHQSGETSPRTSRTGSASFRGEEMMKGAERSIFHDLVWTKMSDGVKNDIILEHAQSATLHPGQALFIPKGWWHSVKGVGDGVTASANWWFR